MPEVRLEVPPRSAYVGVVRLAIAALARAVGLGEEAVDDLRIAVSEALANAVLSTEDALTDKPIVVTWTTEGGRAVVEVADNGVSRDPEALAAGDVDRLTGDLFSSGDVASRTALSVALMRALVDECSFSARDGGGLATRLVLDLHASGRRGADVSDSP